VPIERSKELRLSLDTSLRGRDGWILIRLLREKTKMLYSS